MAYAGRYPGDPPEGEEKYKLPPDFGKSQVVFNLHRAAELAKAKGLVVVEGFFDCFRIWQSGFPNVVSLMGSFMSLKQKELLIAAVGSQGKITLLFDQDEAGRTCTSQCLQHLSLHMLVKHVSLPQTGI